MQSNNFEFFKPDYETEARKINQFLRQFEDQSITTHEIHGKNKYVIAM